MDFIVEDILSGELVPVLLGISPEANQTARRFSANTGWSLTCSAIKFR